MNTDDRPAGSQPPQGQPPGGYSQPPPQQRPAMPNMSQMSNMGGGNPYLVNPDIRLNSIERITVLLLRLVAWISLIIVIISVCADGLSYLTAGGITFGGLLNATARYLGAFATGAIAAVTLLALASIVESLIVIRQNRSM